MSTNHHHHNNNTPCVVIGSDEIAQEFSTMINSKSSVKVIVNSEVSTSEKIRLLEAKGISRGDISRHLNIKYQFVRNVLLRQSEKVAKAATK